MNSLTPPFCLLLTDCALTAYGELPIIQKRQVQCIFQERAKMGNKCNWGRRLRGGEIHVRLALIIYHSSQAFGKMQDAGVAMVIIKGVWQ